MMMFLNVVCRSRRILTKSLILGIKIIKINIATTTYGSSSSTAGHEGSVERYPQHVQDSCFETGQQQFGSWNFHNRELSNCV
ncbi:unnamed protein product [Nesidiocoris tenuis]|uniref:Uncharacterized protein n=1 Tax=Nesidiocoris tenuis TaxID=355587 RepID=A0A6H5FVG8_9HEMI|nr:unnamed protein product [Nesidiocoris tenuis]